jgi:hypothetical protein
MGIWDPTVSFCLISEIHDREYILPNREYCNLAFICSPCLLLLPVAVYCKPFMITQYVWDTHTLHPKYFCNCCTLTCCTVHLVGTKDGKFSSKYVVFMAEMYIRICSFRFCAFYSNYIICSYKFC